MRRFLVIAVIGLIGSAVAACQLYLGQDQAESRRHGGADAGIHQPDGGGTGSGCCLPDGGFINDGSITPPGDGSIIPPGDAGHHHPH